MAVEDVTIVHRHTGAVLFAGTVESEFPLPQGAKLAEAYHQAMSADADLTGADLKGIIFSGHSSYLHVPGADLTGALFHHCDLAGSAEGATLVGATFFHSHVRKCDLSHADLSGTGWEHAHVERSFFNHADFTGACLRHASFKRAEFSPEIFAGDLRDADFSEAKFQPKSLTGDFEGMLLDRACFAPFFKAEYWMHLTHNRGHVPALLSALRDGAVQFEFAGARSASFWRTLCAARNERLTRPPSCAEDRQACETLFGFLQPSDRPDSPTPGGLVLRMLIEWTEDYINLIAEPAKERGEGPHW
ncbi:pentapeptide repeat-containing protein [Terrihabitans sp. B22-R8]|uniref:pentapeptide repeat-containing protein n=1 Tax=Terrihabitans sp. B22-R8 TaxID=3425128 RepID=UPI00403D122F